VADSVPPADDFFDQFLDDYFAECEEHLAVVRRDLLNIEQFVDRPGIDAGQLDELFRSFHTMKGISGMVGLPAAEQLSHEMEDYLRVLRKGDTKLSKAGFEALIEGTRVLGEVLDAHRSHSPIPDIRQSIEALQTATSFRNDKVSTAPLNDMQSTASTSNEWRFLFVPSQGRSDAGINVNTVRSRLQSIGEIIRTTPLVENGDVVFEFIVSTASEAAPEDLTDLGLACFPIKQEYAAVLENAPSPKSS
jgi:two-component system chemotaxis sensor kinase CheA